MKNILPNDLIPTILSFTAPSELITLRTISKYWERILIVRLQNHDDAPTNLSFIYLLNATRMINRKILHLNRDSLCTTTVLSSIKSRSISPLKMQIIGKYIQKLYPNVSPENQLLLLNGLANLLLSEHKDTRLMAANCLEHIAHCVSYSHAKLLYSFFAQEIAGYAYFSSCVPVLFKETLDAISIPNKDSFLATLADKTYEINANTKSPLYCTAIIYAITCMENATKRAQYVAKYAKTFAQEITKQLLRPHDAPVFCYHLFRALTKMRYGSQLNARFDTEAVEIGVHLNADNLLLTLTIPQRFRDRDSIVERIFVMCLLHNYIVFGNSNSQHLRKLISHISRPEHHIARYCVALNLDLVPDADKFTLAHHAIKHETITIWTKDILSSIANCDDFQQPPGLPAKLCSLFLQLMRSPINRDACPKTLVARFLTWTILLFPTEQLTSLGKTLAECTQDHSTSVNEHYQNLLSMFLHLEPIGFPTQLHEKIARKLITKQSKACMIIQDLSLREFQYSLLFDDNDPQNALNEIASLSRI